MAAWELGWTVTSECYNPFSQTMAKYKWYSGIAVTIRCFRVVPVSNLGRTLATVPEDIWWFTLALQVHERIHFPNRPRVVVCRVLSVVHESLILGHDRFRWVPSYWRLGGYCCLHLQSCPRIAAWQKWVYFVAKERVLQLVLSQHNTVISSSSSSSVGAGILYDFPPAHWSVSIHS